MLAIEPIPVEEFAPGKEMGVNVLRIRIGHIQQWIIRVALSENPVTFNVLLPMFESSIRKETARENAFILTDANQEQANKDDVSSLKSKFVPVLSLIQIAQHRLF